MARGAQAALFLAAAGIAFSACGAAAVSAPLQTEVATERAARDQALTDFGSRFVSAVSHDTVRSMLVSDSDLSDLVNATGESREQALRLIPVAFSRWSAASVRGFSFSGLCVQNARVESPDGGFGLLRPAWVFDRVLLVLKSPEGRRLAAWVDGLFVLTSRGIWALHLRQIEQPRWEHSDLELAMCDARVGTW